MPRAFTYLVPVPVLAGLFSSSWIQVLQQHDGEQVEIVGNRCQQLGDLGRFGTFLHQIIKDQHAWSLLGRKEACHVFGQTWVKVHSQGSKVVEDGLPARAVAVHDFSEITEAAVFTLKIGGASRPRRRQALRKDAMSYMSPKGIGPCTVPQLSTWIRLLSIL